MFGDESHHWLEETGRKHSQVLPRTGLEYVVVIELWLNTSLDTEVRTVARDDMIYMAKLGENGFLHWRAVPTDMSCSASLSPTADCFTHLP